MLIVPVTSYINGGGGGLGCLPFKDNIKRKNVFHKKNLKCEI